MWNTNTEVAGLEAVGTHSEKERHPNTPWVHDYARETCYFCIPETFDF
jgi:hypothetical protein